MVVNGDGTVVFDQADTATLSRYGNGSSRAATVTAGLAGETGVSTSGTAATERGRIVAYTPVDGTGWTLLVRTPAESAYALRALVSDRLVLLLGTAILGLACVGVVLGRNTARTLEELAANARSIARGETDVTVEETARQDEVGEMVESFARTQSYLATVEAQADALARQDFDAPVLEETVPGDIGTSLDAMAADLEALIEDIEQARAEAEQSRAAAAEINQELEAEAERLGAAMERAADGDLTQRLDAETDHESMRAITTAFNGMLDELETTVDTIQAFADEVASTSGAVAERSEELRTRRQRVSDAVEGIATDATSQTADLERANAELDELSATIQEVAASADEVASVSAAAASRGTEGKDRATAALERMDRIEDRTEEAVREIERLAEEMADIVSVVDLIDDIAEQTNTLALNASIEAARAGEAGEGFAVVADEVKSLAEETQAATEEIETRIARVESTTESAVDDITATGELVAEGAETIESSLTALEEIGDAVARANEGVQSIDGATDEQAASSQEVVTMVDRVTEIGQRTATEATDVAETTQQQAVDVDDITDRVQSLSGRAEELRAEVERFETGSRVPDTTPDPSVDGEHAEPASVRTADPEPTSDD
jgi:methyl-accepting chemotaxis protein